MLRFGLDLIVFTLTIVAAKAEPLILIDHEWNVRHAKLACEKAKAECAGDPTLAVHMFEARITTAAARSAKCEGVATLKLTAGRKINHPTGEPTWFLKLDDWELDKAEQPWSLNLAAEPHLYGGRGDPEAIAAAVCEIIKARSVTR